MEVWVAVISTTGVVVGVVLGWALTQFSEHRRAQRERAREEINRRRKLLLDIWDAVDLLSVQGDSMRREILLAGDGREERLVPLDDRHPLAIESMQTARRLVFFVAQLRPDDEELIRGPAGDIAIAVGQLLGGGDGRAVRQPFSQLFEHATESIQDAGATLAERIGGRIRDTSEVSSTDDRSTSSNRE